MFSHLFQKINIIFILSLLPLACSETSNQSINSTGSTEKQEATNNTASIITPNWKIIYYRSGGIMGLIQEMTLTHDGQRLLSNHGKTAKTLAPLTTPQMANINQQIKKLSAMPPVKPSKKSNFKCRDCFNTKVHIQYGEQLIQFSALDLASAKDTNYQQLLQFLSGITPMR